MRSRAGPGWTEEGNENRAELQGPAMSTTEQTGQGKTMVAYQEQDRSYLLECQHCKGVSVLATVRSEQRAREVATRWGWKLQTERGDLCPRCEGLRQYGLL